MNRWGIVAAGSLLLIAACSTNSSPTSAPEASEEAALEQRALRAYWGSSYEIQVAGKPDVAANSIRAFNATCDSIRETDEAMTQRSLTDEQVISFVEENFDISTDTMRRTFRAALILCPDTALGDVIIDQIDVVELAISNRQRVRAEAEGKATLKRMKARRDAANRIDRLKDQGKMFNAGTHRVGKDVQPGVYVSRSLGGCYWERTDRDGNTIDNNFVTGTGTRVEFTIYDGDYSVTTDNCRMWKRIG